MATRLSALVRRAWQPLMIGVAAVALVVGFAPWRTVEGATFLAPPTLMPAAAYNAPAGDVAVLSGGCFWGLQGVFEHVKGVKQVVAGYAGGQGATANYELVSTGTTGHAESIKVDLRSRPDLLRARSCASTSRSPPTPPRSAASTRTKARSIEAKSGTPTRPRRRWRSATSPS